DELEDMVAFADARVTGDHGVRTDTRAAIDLHMLPDDGVRPDLHIRGEPGPPSDERSGMDHPSLIVHISSASVTSTPSTVACAANFPMPRTCRSMLTLRISWSPGVTGFLKRALSMPTK